MNTDGTPIDVVCTRYSVAVANDTYYVYEYYTENGRFLDHIIRDRSGIIIEKHNRLWKIIGEAFVDSTPDYV